MMWESKGSQKTRIFIETISMPRLSADESSRTKKEFLFNDADVALSYSKEKIIAFPLLSISALQKSRLWRSKHVRKKKLLFSHLEDSLITRS